MNVRMLTEDHGAAGVDASLDIAPDWTVELTRRRHWQVRAVIRNCDARAICRCFFDPRDYVLDACREVMARGARSDTARTDVAVLERLPMDEMTPGIGRPLCWLLASLLARPVAQKLNGQMLMETSPIPAYKLEAGFGHPTDLRDQCRSALPTMTIHYPARPRPNMSVCCASRRPARAE